MRNMIHSLKKLSDSTFMNLPALRKVSKAEIMQVIALSEKLNFLFLLIYKIKKFKQILNKLNYS